MSVRRQRVREQIEKDKKDRAAKFGGGSSVDAAKAVTQSSVEGPGAGNQATAVGGASVTSPASVGPKEYTATKLQAGFETFLLY